MTRARDLARLGNSQALSVDSNLNVGINSTAPVSKLNVVGVVSATSFYGSGSNLTGVGGSISIAPTSGATFRVLLTNASSAGTLTASAFNATLNYDSSTGTLNATKFSGDGSSLNNLNIPAGFNELDAALFN